MSGISIKYIVMKNKDSIDFHNVKELLYYQILR